MSVFVVFLGEECVGVAGAICSARAADSVNVILDLHWEIIVDHVLDVRYIYSMIKNVIVESNLPIPLEATSVAIKIVTLPYLKFLIT